MTRRALAVRAALGLAAAAGFVALLLARDPWVLAADDPERPAPAPSCPGVASDVLLVASAEAVLDAAAAPLAERDWSFAWVSTLEQEVGPWRLATPGGIGAEELGAARVVVLPPRAAEALPAQARELLARRAAEGAVVVVEGAVPDWLPAERVVAVRTGFARSLVRTQQGWCEDGASAPSCFPGVPAGLLQPHGLADPSLPAEAFEPVADRLERDVLRRVEALAPLARWWPHPGGAPGTLALTVDEEGFGDRAAWMAEELARQRAPSTTFALPGTLTSVGGEALERHGSTLHVHWNRGFLGDLSLDRSLFHARELPLVDQAWRVAALRAGPEQLRISRTHGLVWDPDFGRTFRRLHAAGVDADASYGPAGPDRLGYVFGTGLPFRPLDATGWPFPLLEVPFLAQDDEAFRPAAWERLVREAAGPDHQLVVPILHANAMARMPCAERMECFLGLVGRARAAGLETISLDGFLDAWRARLVSPLTSTWDGDRLEVRAVARHARLAVRVPAAFSGRAAAELRLDGVAVVPRRFGEALVVPVPEGQHLLDVRYP